MTNNFSLLERVFFRQLRYQLKLHNNLIHLPRGYFLGSSHVREFIRSHSGKVVAHTDWSVVIHFPWKHANKLIAISDAYDKEYSNVT